MFVSLIHHAKFQEYYRNLFVRGKISRNWYSYIVMILAHLYTGHVSNLGQEFDPLCSFFDRQSIICINDHIQQESCFLEQG